MVKINILKIVDKEIIFSLNYSQLITLTQLDVREIGLNRL